MNKEEFEKIKRRAEQGVAKAQFRLAVCYYYGEGVEKDREKAVEWWTKAAKQGHAESQYHLGVCYENGNGVKRDPEEAKKWYEKVVWF